MHNYEKIVKDLTHNTIDNEINREKMKVLDEAIHKAIAYEALEGKANIEEKTFSQLTEKGAVTLTPYARAVLGTTELTQTVINHNGIVQVIIEPKEQKVNMTLVQKVKSFRAHVQECSDVYKDHYTGDYAYAVDEVLKWFDEWFE